jgi:hypothetical protein
VYHKRASLHELGILKARGVVGTTLTMDRPLLHVHVSGSAGTAMCAMARQQSKPAKARGTAGGAYACLYGCKNPALWEDLYAMGNKDFTSFFHCLSLAMTCRRLESGLRSGGYGVMGAVESTLDESASTAYPNATAAFRNAMRKTPCENKKCCGCTVPGLLRSPTPGVARGLNASVLVVRRGEHSPFDDLWPPEGWAPLSTYCQNIRYSFLMHEPLHRLLSQLRLQCPGSNRSNAPAWSIAVLRFIYEHDLVLDTNDGGKGFPATAATSNFNTRVLLGPRVHFARLRGVTRAHHDATLALLGKYSLVMPVRALGHANASEVIARALGWSRPPTVPVKNRHERAQTDREEAVVMATMGDTLREHNQWDLLTYAWVNERFQQRVASLTSTV